MANLTKDPMILFRNTKRGKNSKGGDRLELYLTIEEAAKVVAACEANKGNPRGIKFDFHTSQKEYQGRSFDSTICFIKAVQPFGSGTGVGAGTTGTTSGVASVTDSTAARIEKLKKEIA